MKYHQIHFDQIDSTNSYLKNSYRLLDDFTFASADYQSDGKGRENRKWESKKGENLLFSVLLKDKKFLANAPVLSIYFAVEIAQLLELYGLKNVSIKWPNDVYVGGKKICGILAESQLPDCIVVGVGLNVNQLEFSDDLRRPATSMRLWLKRKIDIDELKIELFGQIMDHFTKLYVENYLSYFREHNYLQEKRVRVTVNNQVFYGEVIGIGEDFCLKVVSRDMLLHIESGEIEIL